MKSVKTCIKESLFGFIALWTIFINKWTSVKNMYGFLRCEPGPHVHTPENCSLCTPDITFSDISCCIFQAHIFILNQQIWFSCGLVITSQFTGWDLEITVLKSSPINFANFSGLGISFFLNLLPFSAQWMSTSVCLTYGCSHLNGPTLSIAFSFLQLFCSSLSPGCTDLPRQTGHWICPWRGGEKIITGVKDREF